jgi:hypothetical protein
MMSAMMTTMTAVVAMVMPMMPVMSLHNNNGRSRSQHGRRCNHQRDQKE